MRIVLRVLPSGESRMGRVSTKYLQKTEDGFVVEATYIKRPEKHTLCVSTQVGCAVGCRFCASGLRREGKLYQRSLTAAEMVAECRNVTDEMDFVAHPKRLTLAFMGEGEPFLNFDECVEAFQVLAQMEWPVPMQISVSTSGVRPNFIRRFAEIEFPVRVKLLVSLHGPNDEVRSRIVPNSKPVAEIAAAVRNYRERCGRPVVWNYVLCGNVNDSPEHAEGLVNLLGPGAHVKFTRLNFTPGSPFFPSPKERVEEFRRIVEAGGLSTAYSETDESNLQAGCGQLSYGYTRE